MEISNPLNQRLPKVKIRKKEFDLEVVRNAGLGITVIMVVGYAIYRVFFG